MQKSPTRPRRRRVKSPRSFSDSAAAAERTESEGLCGVAMLKIAMELKKRASVPVEEVIGSVLSTMAIEPSTFRKYLTSQGGVAQRLETMRRGQRP